MKAQHARRRMRSHAWMKVQRLVVASRSQSVAHLLQVQADAVACMQMHTWIDELMHDTKYSYIFAGPSLHTPSPTGHRAGLARHWRYDYLYVVLLFALFWA